MTFRLAQGFEPQWFDMRLERGGSNFLFVDQHFQSHPVLRRIFSLARKLGYQSLTLEKIREGDCALLREENAYLSVRTNEFVSGSVTRICFFKSVLGQEPAAGDFVGYAIVKADLYRTSAVAELHVYEAVLAPHRTSEGNTFLHTGKEYDVSSPIGVQRVFGVIYAQQNDRTYVCAHAAMRTALSCLLPAGDISYQAINQILGIDHRNKLVGGGAGLSPDEMERVFDALHVDFTKVVHEPLAVPLLSDYQRDLYAAIESAAPAILGFELKTHPIAVAGAPAPPAERHVISVFGHTFNDDAWVPEAQRFYFIDAPGYYSSENWLSAYVVHDDNFGPYFCLPRHFLTKTNFRLLYGFKARPSVFTGYEAELIAVAYFAVLATNVPDLGIRWYDRFAIFARTQQLVLRSLNVSRDEYIRHLRGCSEPNGTRIEEDVIVEFTARLPQNFWMVEASAPELFPTTRRKFGEVLIASNQALPTPLDISLLLAFRLPGRIFWLDNGTLSQRPIALAGHCGLFSYRVT